MPRRASSAHSQVGGPPNSLPGAGLLVPLGSTCMHAVQGEFKAYAWAARLLHDSPDTTASSIVTSMLFQRLRLCMQGIL